MSEPHEQVTRPERSSRLLILGGTGEARRLAQALQDAGLPFLSSLAGRVSNPAMPAGPTRVGGFGGADGLARYLRAERIAAVVDATHPFAATMTANAAVACTATGVPLLRLQRPSWADHPHAADWTWVDDHPQAAASAVAAAERIFLTTGRQTLEEFMTLPGMAQRYVLARLVEPPTYDVPQAWEILRSRGPFTKEGEVELMRDRRVGVLVTKDSGGGQTESKLDAAAELGLPVVVVRRPALPAGMAEVADVASALGWAREVLATG